jgi:hypothetical protein
MLYDELDEIIDQAADEVEDAENDMMIANNDVDRIAGIDDGEYEEYESEEEEEPDYYVYGTGGYAAEEDDSECYEDDGCDDFESDNDEDVEYELDDEEEDEDE